MFRLFLLLVQMFSSKFSFQNYRFLIHVSEIYITTGVITDFNTLEYGKKFIKLMSLDVTYQHQNHTELCISKSGHVYNNVSFLLVSLNMGPFSLRLLMLKTYEMCVVSSLILN
jgi:hypothetical protein